MCLCRQTAVHIYEPDRTFMENVLGQPINRWLRTSFDPPPPGTPQFEFIDCWCANAYLPVALYGGGLFSLLAHSIAVAFLTGMAMGARSQRLIQIAIGWAIVTLAGIAYNYTQFLNDKQLVVEPSVIARAERTLEMYLISIPIQFAFNAILFLALPTLIFLGLKRLKSRKLAVTSNQPME